jgi:hypothetical protein
MASNEEQFSLVFGLLFLVFLFVYFVLGFLAVVGFVLVWFFGIPNHIIYFCFPYLIFIFFP